MKARAAALALLAGLPLAAQAEPPLCRAEVVLSAPRAYVGQPVLHRVRIEQRREVIDLRWETSLSFPAFRAEPILGPGGPGERTAATETIEERRMLFPARAGRLALPAARIACESATRLETTEVPASELLVEDPPLEGRPPGWAGLIGPVEITAFATPDRVALGESVSLAVTVSGATNVWAAPVAPALPPDVAELFERPSELARDMGRTLALRSYRSFDVVPRRAGTLDIPELRVAYFDPATKRYGEARAPALHVEVSARGTVPAANEAPPDEAASAPAAGPGAAAVAALGLALAAGLGAGFWLGRRPRPRRPGAGRAHIPDVREAAGALEAALARGDGTAAAAAAARAVRIGLERWLPGARSLAVEELAARAPAAAQADVALLARLERARFTGAGAAALLALAREANAPRP